MLGKIFSKIRAICDYFVYTLLVLWGLSLFFKFQRFKFFIFLSGVIYILYFFLVSPVLSAHILLFTSQALPFNFALSVFGRNIKPLEFIALFTISIWASLYIINPAKRSPRMKIGFMELFLIVFMMVFAVEVIRGICAGNHIGEKATFFRSDVFRGPIYYVLYFFFLKIMILYEGSLSSLIKTWYHSVLIGIVLFVVLASRNYMSGYAFSFWGFNFQVFSFFVGWIFALWLLSRKPFYLFALVIYMILVFFIASRTVFVGMLLVIFFVTAIWLIYFEENKLKFVLNVVAVIIVFGVIILVYSLFLSASEYRAVAALLRNKQLLHVRYLKYLPSIQARIIESCSAIFNWKNSNKLIGAPFGEIISMYAGLNIIDVFYANLLGKMGLMGLFSFLGFMGVFFRRSVIVMKRLALLELVEVKAFVLMSVAMIPTALIMAITMNHLWFAPGTIITIAFSGAVITTLWNQTRKNI